MALYEIQFRGADHQGARLKSALVLAPDAEKALDDVAHLIRPQDRDYYKVTRMYTTARKLLFTSDEW